MIDVSLRDKINGLDELFKYFPETYSFYEEKK